jgi:hypothetical protein
MSQKIKFTMHAVVRWKERFPSFNKEQEWEESLPGTKGVLKQIRKQCPASSYKIRSKQPFYKYMLSKNMIVFAYDMTGVVITVFPLNTPVAPKGFEWRVTQQKNLHAVELRKIKRY